MELGANLHYSATFLSSASLFILFCLSIHGMVEDVRHHVHEIDRNTSAKHDNQASQADTVAERYKKEIKFYQQIVGYVCTENR